MKDLITVLESELGIRIFIRPIEERNISGLFIFDENVGACITFNSHHSPERRRQSAAHETGHFVGTRGVPYRDSSSIEHVSRREERFAKRFGLSSSDGLAPSVRAMFSDLIQEHGRFSSRHLILVAARFGVSNEAACRRLEDLGLLPSRTWESIRSRGFPMDNLPANF